VLHAGVAGIKGDGHGVKLVSSNASIECFTIITRSFSCMDIGGDAAILLEYYGTSSVIDLLNAVKLWVCRWQHQLSRPGKRQVWPATACPAFHGSTQCIAVCNVVTQQGPFLRTCLPCGLDLHQLASQKVGGGAFFDPTHALGRPGPRESLSVTKSTSSVRPRMASDELYGLTSPAAAGAEPRRWHGTDPGSRTHRRFSGSLM
jgi:hypothetical protein